MTDQHQPQPEQAKVFNRWEKLNVLLSALIPITIAAVGWYLADQSEKSAREERNLMIQLSKFQADREDERKRWALVPSFIEALTGEEGPKKEIAIRSIRSVLGEKADTILASLPQQNLSAPLQAVIDESLRNVGASLLSNDKQIRVGAYSTLAANPNRQTETAVAVSKAVADARAQKRSLTEQGMSQGLWNAMMLLSSFDASALRAARTSLVEILDFAASNGPETKSFVDQIRKKLGSP